MNVIAAPAVKYNLPTNNEFEVAVAFVPQFNLSNQAVFYNGADISIMKDTTDAERLAAWLFIEYITNTENTTELAMTSGFVPLRYSAFDTTIYQEYLNTPQAIDIYSSKASMVAYLQLDHLKYTPGFKTIDFSSATVREQAKLAIEAIFASGLTNQEIIDSLYAHLND